MKTKIVETFLHYLKKLYRGNGQLKIRYAPAPGDYFTNTAGDIYYRDNLAPIPPKTFMELRAGASIDIEFVSAKISHEMRTMELS